MKLKGKLAFGPTRRYDVSMWRYPSRRGFLSGAATSILSTEMAGAATAEADAVTPLAGLDEATAITRYIRDKLGDLVSVRECGATGDGVADDTEAFQAAIDKAGYATNAYTSVFIPPGTYRITRTIRLDKRHIHLFGAGETSCLYFDPAGPERVMILVQNTNSADLINYITLERFGFRASVRSGNFSKTGIKLVDASFVTISGVNIADYSWVGGDGLGSIGIHMCGRDSHRLVGCAIVADAPIFADRNPNSTQYVFDYHHFSGMYLETKKTSNYAITFAPGVNPSNWIVDGNCGAFTGKGGIYLNNQGVRTETPSMIRISHFRVESGKASGGDPGGYGIYMDFGTGNPACGNLTIENCSVNDPTCNGYHLRNVSALVATNVNCGFSAGNEALTCIDVRNAYVTSLGIGHPQARVQMNGLRAQTLHKIAGSTEASPSIAFGVFVQAAADMPDASLIYENGVRKWSSSQILNDGDEMLLPSLTVDGSMIVNVSSDFGASTYSATPRDTFELNSTPEWSARVKLVSDGAGRTTLVNLRAGARRFVVTTHGS